VKKTFKSSAYALTVFGRARASMNSKNSEVLCRQVLAGDEPGIVDLRAQRAVGVDTMEDLRPFYELKLYDGPEPAVIDLTDSDVTR
jgi:hypothetical protein